ncbi:hypothetical protein AB205_0041340, partial [Aquarana catesbeiana]
MRKSEGKFCTIDQFSYSVYTNFDFQMKISKGTNSKSFLVRELNKRFLFNVYCFRTRKIRYERLRLVTTIFCLNIFEEKQKVETMK